MKTCPRCQTSYENDDLNFCLDDGTALTRAVDPGAATVVMGPPPVTAPPQRNPNTAAWQPPQQYPQPKKSGSKALLWVGGILALVMLLCGGGVGALLLVRQSQTQNQSFDIPAATPIPAVSRTPRQPADGNSDQYLTMANYNLLKIGTPRSEVEEILGGKGIEISSSSGGGMSFSVNKWEGEKFKSIILTFRDDKIMSKSQVGLK